MRQAIALVVLVVLLGACAVPQTTVVTTPTASPAPTASAAPAPETASPAPPASPTPNRTSEPLPTEPPIAPAPVVRVAPQLFSVGLVASLTEVQGRDRADAEGMVRGWVPTYLQALDKYRGDYNDANRFMFDQFHVPGPYAEVVRWSLQFSGFAAPTTSRTFELEQVSIQHVFAKPWGRVAFMDITLTYLDRVTTADGKSTAQQRVQQMRIVNQGRGLLKVIDGFDPVLNRWIDGEQARWSALALQGEAPSAVGAYLQRESYVPGEAYPHGTPANSPLMTESPFSKTWNGTLARLDTAYKAGEFATRRFEDVVVRIGRFEPATFLGDGIVTVVATGRLVLAKAGAPETSTAVTRTLRFYRITRDGLNAFWLPVDEQLATGDWQSGGQLALAEIDQDRG